MKVSLEDARRFWAKVDKGSSEGDCWKWTSATSDGRPSFTLDDRSHHAVAVACHIHKGPRPPGHITVRVGCETRLCVRPSHFEYMTRADAARLHNRRFTTEERREAASPRGTEHPEAKLNPYLVRWIRKARAAGFRLRDLAERLSVSESTVSNVDRGVSWRHV